MADSWAALSFRGRKKTVVCGDPGKECQRAERQFLTGLYFKISVPSVLEAEFSVQSQDS